jgi:hypothetical protein
MHDANTLSSQTLTRRGPCSTTSIATSSSVTTTRDRDAHQPLSHSATLYTTPRLKPKLSTERTTTRKHHCTIRPFSAAPLLTLARATHRWKWAVVSWVSGFFACLFFPCSFDRGDLGIWGFSLACFGARVSVEQVFPCVGGMPFCGADAEVVQCVPRLPVDARTSPQPSLTRSTRCAGAPSGLCALALRVLCNMLRILHIFLCAVYPAPSSAVVRRSLYVRRTNESVVTLTHDRARISLCVSLPFFFFVSIVARTIAARARYLHAPPA